MSQQMTNTPLLMKVRNGMRVLDSRGEEIGVVEMVYFGGAADDAIEFGSETATSPDITADNDSGGILGAIADAFRDDNVPDVLARRMLKEGYIRLDAHGLFAADRYILPEQITSVTADGIHLNTTRDGLLHR
jgi:hypothetical protein